MIEDGILWQYLRSPQLRITEWGDRGVFVFTCSGSIKRETQTVPAACAGPEGAPIRLAYRSTSVVTVMMWSSFCDQLCDGWVTIGQAPLWIRRVVGRVAQTAEIAIVSSPRHALNRSVRCRIPLKTQVTATEMMSVVIMVLEPRLCAASQQSPATVRYQPPEHCPAMAASTSAATAEIQRSFVDTRAFGIGNPMNVAKAFVHLVESALVCEEGQGPPLCAHAGSQQ